MEKKYHPNPFNQSEKEAIAPACQLKKSRSHTTLILAQITIQNPYLHTFVPLPPPPHHNHADLPEMVETSRLWVSAGAVARECGLSLRCSCCSPAALAQM